VTEFQRCDIIIRPNLAIFPGCFRLPGANNLGHAAIVIQDAQDSSEAVLLKKTVIFESQARDVPGEYQLRVTHPFVPGKDFRFANFNFSPDKQGRLYRLRMDLTTDQKDSIIAFLMSHADDLSDYRALKRYGPVPDSRHGRAQPGEQEYWYCSLLIWQAFYDVLGIDLDADKGMYVFPNDLVYSPYFDDGPGEKIKRIRF